MKTKVSETAINITHTTVAYYTQEELTLKDILYISSSLERFVQKKEQDAEVDKRKKLRTNLTNNRL